MATGEVMVDGSLSWEGGVDSIKVSTIASPSNPDGLARNENAWLINATVRDGGILQRPGWQPMGLVADSTAFYQGGIVYQPIAGDPYLLVLISGHVLKVTLTSAPAVTDLSMTFGTGLDNLQMPANQVQAFFVQAEQFVVIQSGDLVTLPLFWDGITLWRSAGLSPAYPTLAELPAGGPMCYYQGRIWIGQWNGKHRIINAGDIVGNQSSGTLPYQFTDSVLRVTESALALGGDGIALPAGTGDIRAIQYSANLDATLGQGTLFVFTRKQVYSLSVPISRTSWISSGVLSAQGANALPLVQVVQLTNGAVSDRSVVQVNGDLFYQTLSTDIQSLSTALKYFQQWGNTPVSSNEYRILSQSDRSLLRLVSGIQFDNRMLMSTLPKQLPQGVVSQAIVPLDFTPISSFGKAVPPAWEGHYEGLNWLQLFNADFGGLERAFGLAVSILDSSVQLWELTLGDQFENGENRITWLVETPSFDFSKTFDLKKLVSLELWFDRLWGTVDFEVYYRPDQYPCWLLWQKFTECAAKSVDEDFTPIIGYPPPTDYREQYRATKVLGLPPNAGCNVATNRPFTVAYQYQLMIRITGFCRIRGILLKALPVEKSLYTGLVNCQ